MANTNFDPMVIMQQVANLMQEVQSLKQQLDKQEKTIARQEQVIKQQQKKIALLESNQKVKHNSLDTGNLGDSSSGITAKTEISRNNKTNLEPHYKRPKLLPISFFTVLVAILSVTLIALIASVKDAQSKIVVNPLGYTQQFGAILLPAASTITGTVSNGTRIGLVATGNPIVDLAALPIFDTGVYASGSGQGVYADSNSSQGYGLYASNTATTGSGSGYAIYGTSQKGIGVGGTSFGAGYGIYGVSNSSAGVYGSGGTGPGVLASSSSGAPFSIRAGPTPTAGDRAFGDFYVDITGKIYVWAKANDGITSNWRQLQFAT